MLLYSVQVNFGQKLSINASSIIIVLYCAKANSSTCLPKKSTVTAVCLCTTCYVWRRLQMVQFGGSIKISNVQSSLLILYCVTPGDRKESMNQPFLLSHKILLAYIPNSDHVNGLLRYERVYLPLCKVADTPFHIQGSDAPWCCHLLCGGSVLFYKKKLPYISMQY